MPCFKGIAVSIHANSAPLPEYGIQKQSRMSRISTYIPVPQPTLNSNNKPEPAKFAISITLLTPGLPIPYSAPKASESNPYPKPQFVGGLHSGSQNERGKATGAVAPYMPLTNSENETIAAYIYFDGRGKEEVATLLRPGEETWVNSRWVQVPDSEGGGLAEREFLFREVGLERWLNGLDLKGHDAAEKLEKRRQKFERRRRRQAAALEETLPWIQIGARELFDMAMKLPPSKLSMMILTPGEIKKGEYSPQFDAHDGDDEYENGNGIDADVEHTTSFAKPKTLDPKTISTQTVTGIDGPDKPYATFTFFYRGERQLQKIGVLQSAKNNSQTTALAAKRRSGQIDFSNLGPLKAGGTVGFSAFRDQEADEARRRKARKKSNGNVADDSDDDDEESEIIGKMEEVADKETNSKLAPEDAKFQGELADGVNRIHRAHSAEPDANSTPETSQRTDSPADPALLGGSAPSASSSLQANFDSLAAAMVGSPLKKARPSVDQTNIGDRFSATQSLSAALGTAVSNKAESPTKEGAATSTPEIRIEEEEEL
ncbi:hypothetical protein TrVFT333_004166 [Trichoderma virens FT-333]|nr:hypothetical protein TrVFT333_004166 [Trichoderma virens FT-333]